MFNAKPPRTTLVAMAVSAILLTGCAKKPDEQLTDAQEDAASWAATARMVHRYWAQDQLPRMYTKQTLDRASYEVDQDLKQARKAASQADSGTASKTVGQIESLSSEVEKLRNAVQ